MIVIEFRCLALATTKFWGANIMKSPWMRVAVVGAVAHLSVVGAFAADLPPAPVYTKAPAYSSAPSWTGFYVGANAGYGWGSGRASYTPNDPDTSLLFGILDPAGGGALPPATSFNASGVIGGLQLGYIWQFNPNWLVGLETDFNWSGLKGTGSSTSLPFGLSAATTAEEQIKWFGTVRARLGYLPMNNLLTYVTGGFAYGMVDRTASYVNTSGVDYGSDGPVLGIDCRAGAPVCATGSSSTRANGWTVGTGFEYAFWNNLTFKAEYLFVSLGSSNSITETAVATCCGVPATSLASFNASFSRNTFNIARVGLNYQFH
jgi:outer membrane immunogenic protein